MRWTFPVSIWSKAGWAKDEDEINAKCFENDWAIAVDRFPKAIKDDDKEKDKIRLILKSNYKLIRWMYKYWASLSTVAGIWCISEANFQLLFNDLDYFGE